MPGQRDIREQLPHPKPGTSHYGKGTLCSHGYCDAAHWPVKEDRGGANTQEGSQLWRWQRRKGGQLDSQPIGALLQLVSCISNAKLPLIVSAA